MEDKEVQMVWRRLGLVVLSGIMMVPIGAEAWSWPFGSPPAAGADDTATPVIVQLGDSVAAGSGLTPRTDSPYDQLCVRSDEAYVNFVAGAKKMQPLNLACSGATVWNGVITDQELESGEVDSQLRQLYNGPAPAVALLTVGANDVRWMAFLADCARSNCADQAHTEAFEALLTSANVGVRTALTSLKVLGAGHVYVTGYYDPLAGQEGAAEQYGFSNEETEWYRARLDELNRTLEQATVGRHYATFVPVDFSGGDTPLVQAPGETAPFHPTAAGQQRIAEAVLASMP